MKDGLGSYRKCRSQPKEHYMACLATSKAPASDQYK